MSSYTDPLIVKFLGNGKWQLAKEFDYHIGEKESKQVIHIPKGFETDFASIPQLFWNILPPTGQYGAAAVVHDYLYRNGGIVMLMKGYWSTFTRKECDMIFYEAMGVLGVNWITKQIIYSAVRTFGGWSWKRK